MARGDFVFCHALRVRWAEVDRQGIVFNGNYLTYFDVGITEYWRAIGYPYPDALLQNGCDTFAVKATIEYRAPARYDDLLDVRCAWDASAAAACNSCWRSIAARHSSLS